jgi:ATP-binding cassette, subfamily G (WHITE), eye pigment precursor transporter
MTPTELFRFAARMKMGHLTPDGIERKV